MSFICLDCIGNPNLKNIIQKDVINAFCTYCKKNKLVISVDKLAQTVNPYILNSYEEEEFSKEFDPFYQKFIPVPVGVSLESVLMHELKIKDRPAEDLAQALQGNDDKNLSKEEKHFYQHDNYSQKFFSPDFYSKSWNDFCSLIKHKRRFFNDSIKILKDILGNDLPEFFLKAGQPDEIIYRARNVNSKDELKRIIKNPIKNLSAPPIEKAIANRMNPEGISVFYGAFSEDTALAEIRPSVGGLIAIGEFSVIKELRLLDLSRIGIKKYLSIFEDEYKKKAARSEFLGKFHFLIGKPIQKTDESLEYIPTQAIAEFVFHELNFNGIVYGSSQLGIIPENENEFINLSDSSNYKSLQGFNIVLFDGINIVEDSDSKRVGKNAFIRLENSTNIRFKKVKNVKGFESDNVEFEIINNKLVKK